MTERGPILNEPDRVVLFGDEWAHEVIYGDLWEEENKEAFLDLFEIADQRLQTKHDFYQGTDFVQTIRRKSDSKLFGYNIWMGGGKYMDDVLESNGETYGFDWEDEAWVWFPVVEETIPTYSIVYPDA